METVHVVQVGSYSRCSGLIISACRMISRKLAFLFTNIVSWGMEKSGATWSDTSEI